MNAKLLRAVLTHVEDSPGLFDTTTYGEVRPSGDIAADIAGRALLLSEWTLTGDSAFRKDGRVIAGPADVEFEAQALLGLSDDELWDNGDLDNLFDLAAKDAVSRLRELTEQAEAAVANA